MKKHDMRQNGVMPYEKQSNSPYLHLPIGASVWGIGGEYPMGGGVRKTSPAFTPSMGWIKRTK